MQTANVLLKSNAVFSPCQRYRYWLERRGLLPLDRTAVFCMLNPSTADENVNDPTVRRCLGFARHLGCGRLIVVNLFAFRATKPADMKAESDPVGPENDVHILRAVDEVEKHGGYVICAWGTHGKYRDRDRAVIRLLQEHDTLNTT